MRQMLGPSPFYLSSPQAGRAHLEITVDGAFDAKLGGGATPRMLNLITPAGASILRPLNFGAPITFDFPVRAGAQTITFTASILDPETGAEVYGRANLLLAGIELDLTSNP